jgi:hypothetical protein
VITINGFNSWLKLVLIFFFSLFSSCSLPLFVQYGSEEYGQDSPRTYASPKPATGVYGGDPHYFVDGGGGPGPDPWSSAGGPPGLQSAYSTSPYGPPGQPYPSGMMQDPLVR